MTSEAQKKAGFLIPDPITGYDLLCVQFLIPNDLLYIGAFTGNLEQLAQWWNWEKTYSPGDTRASQAAAYWRRLIDTYLCIGFNQPIGDDGVACCCGGSGALTRFTSDGTFETSTDGGITWTPNPGADPRNQAIAVAPLPGSGDNVKCAAADNVRDQFKVMRDNLIALLTAGTVLTAIISGLAAFLGVIMGVSGVATFFGVLLIGLATELLSLTPASVASQLDDTVMDDFRCLVYCRMEDNGQLTYDDWHGLLSDIDSQFSGFPHTFFFSIVNSMGYIGLSNAGTMGAATADDCSGCDCECGGETVGLTLVFFHGTEISASGCNIKATATPDGDHNAVTMTWDGTHSWKLVAEGLIPPPSDPDTMGSHWQWYTWDGSEHGPFTGVSAPIGVEVTTIELFGEPGGEFSVSWDVATP